MILVRGIQTFRERCPEWVMAAVTASWGWNAWTDSFADVKKHTFDSPFYAPLLSTGVSQFWWGLMAVTVGCARLTCLIINGSRPRGSTTFRALGAWLSFMFWTGLWIGAVQLPWNAGGRITYFAFMAFDGFSMIFAARDMNTAFARVREAATYGHQ